MNFVTGSRQKCSREIQRCVGCLMKLRFKNRFKLTNVSV